MFLIKSHVGLSYFYTINQTITLSAILAACNVSGIVFNWLCFQHILNIDVSDLLYYHALTKIEGRVILRLKARPKRERQPSV
jgi:hypothetical protein